MNCRRGLGEGEELLEALGAGVEADEGLEDSQHPAAILDHALKNISKAGLALRFAMPFGEHGGRHFNIAAQLVSRVAAEEESIEEGRFALRVLEVAKGFVRSYVVELHGCKKGAVYPKA